jgi:hypothetical protein
MTSIDKIIVEANLRSARVLDFDHVLAEIANDIAQWQIIVAKHRIQDTQTLSTLMAKHTQLQQQIAEWAVTTGLDANRQYRAVVVVDYV